MESEAALLVIFFFFYFSTGNRLDSYALDRYLFALRSFKEYSIEISRYFKNGWALCSPVMIH